MSLSLSLSQPIPLLAESQPMSGLIDAFQNMLSNSANDPKGIHNSESAKDTEVEKSITTLKDLLPKDGSGGSFDREKLRDAAHKLSLALETPGDTVQRVAYLV